jgi:hypothetical protein
MSFKYNKKHKFRNLSKCTFLHSELRNILHFMFFPNSDKISYPYTRESNICCEIPGLHLGANEVFALLGCYAAYVNCCLPTCR